MKKFKRRLLVGALIGIISLITCTSQGLETPGQGELFHTHTLSAAQFQQSIRPQIQGILQDFFAILKIIAPVGQQLLPYRASLGNLRLMLDQLRPDMDISAQEKLLHNFWEEVISIDQGMLQIQDSLFYSENKIDPHFFDTITQISIPLQQLSHAASKMQHQLEIFRLFIHSFPHRHMAQETLNLQEEVGRMFIYLEQALISAIPSPWRDQFINLWMDYIKVLADHILPQNDMDFFLKKIAYFNFCWNDFHMKLNKTTPPLPPSVLNLMMSMHNHWNAVLREILN